MKNSSITLLVAAALMTGVNGNAVAADKKGTADLGKREYQNNCVLCHGDDGKGNGSLVELLKKKPADLTSLSKKNGGVFPFDRVYAMIDGREMVVGHGDREMPAWGNRYNADVTKAAEYYVDVPYDMEMYVRSRILALIDYLHRIQTK
ncbi:MAG: c-type cytochrome [Betaproteobacteria bacterium]|nr:c-type cytochrome [Betaproteobacteria bacterium]